MTPDIIIHKAIDGTTRMTAHIGKGSMRNFMLMERDDITLKFSSDTPVRLRLGDYVELPVGSGSDRYELTKPTSGEYNKNTSGYDYEIKLDAQYWKFKNKLCKFLPQIGSNETTWAYTDTFENHTRQILFNLRAQAYKRNDDGTEILIQGRESFLYNGAYDWSIVWDSSIDTTKAVTIQYDKTNIIDAIAGIAEAYGCEWWFEHEVLHFGRCEFGETPITLEMGKELVAITKSSSKETYATRLFIYGSDRNIASNYRKSLIFDASVDGDKLQDPERPLEIEWFRPEELTCMAKADKQITLELETVSEEERSLEYGVSGTQSASLPMFGKTSDDFIAEGERTTLTQAGHEFSWLFMEKPYLVLSNLRLTLTPTEFVKVTDAIIPTHITAAITFVIDYYKEGEGQVTKETISKKVETIGIWNGLNQSIDFKFVDEFLSLPSRNVVDIRILNKAVGFALCYNDSADDEHYGYVYAQKPKIKAKTSMRGQIGVFEGWPEFNAEGVVIEVLDKSTGEVSETITGVTFNADFEDNHRRLTLPEGTTIASGAKYRLPQLNEAIVPARHFTSIYSVFEKYQDITTNGIVNRRLLLPEKDEDGNPLKGYIDVCDFESEEEAVEDVVIFEDVYPSRVSKIVEIARSDEYVDEQQEQDGSITETAWRAYKYKDDLFNSNNPFDIDNYGILDAELQITFQSGLLNGMTFGVAYDKESHFFEIQRDTATNLPNETIKPKVGDEFILHGFNIAMLSDSNTDYISNAEKELLQKAREYAAKLNIDTTTYQCTVGCDTAYAAEAATPGSLFMQPGQRVNLVNTAYFEEGRISRVLGYEMPLDLTYDNPVYTIGEKTKYSRIGAIEDRLNGIGNQTGNFASMLGGGGISGSGNGGGGAIHLIGRYDATAPSDRNAYSALRARLEFALKTAAETISHLWKFLKGIEIGNFVSGFSGAQIDEDGNTEVESLYSRSWLKVQELIYNRLNALEGDTSFSDIGTIEQITDNDDGTQTASMRMRWDGDFTAFQPGDVVYGYVNNLDNADEKEYYKAWVWVKSVDRAANEIILVSYPDIDTPAGKNYPMAEGMIITRWGNNIVPMEDTYLNEDYSAVIKLHDGKYINTRQSSFFISCEGGNIIELMGVDKPKLEPGNYGSVLGKIPENLLDEETAKYLNPDQPYLYARGIVVQDLIRINYDGSPIYTPNFRGEWNADEAADAETYYRRDKGLVDLVYWDGALWQCVTEHASTNPPSEDSNEWMKVSASLDAVWEIIPSTNVVYIRTNTYSTDLLECTIRCHATNGTHEITTPEELDKYGMELVYSLDGVNYTEYWVRDGATFDFEDDNGDGIEIGSTNVPWNEVIDRITLFLKDKKSGNVVKSLMVPVVRDGIDGDDGEGLPGKDGSHTETRYKIVFGHILADADKPADGTLRIPGNGWELTHGDVYVGYSLWQIHATIDGDDNLVGTWCDPFRMTGEPGESIEGEPGALAYPAGVFDPLIFYDSTQGTTPVVMDGVDGRGEGQYYVLEQNQTYCGNDAPENHKSPREDCVTNGSDGIKPKWKKADHFKAIFADIFMANFAKLASAVFYENLMFSQQGTDGNGNPRGTSAADAYAYKDLNAKTLGETDPAKWFIPNFSIDFKTGDLKAGKGTFGGSIQTSLVKLQDSDAEDVGSAGVDYGQIYRIRKDLKLMVSSHTYIELPISPEYIGAEITICESQKNYSRNDIACPVMIRAQGGDTIGGIEASEKTNLDDYEPTRTVYFRDGVTKFLGIPANYIGSTDEKTKWMLISAAAHYLEGSKY